MKATRLKTIRNGLVWFLATAGIALLLPTPAGAAGRDGGFVAAAPVLEVGPYEQAVARRIDLSIGRSLIVDLPRDAKEVFVANPKVANAVVRSTRKLFVIGMENGATSIFVMDGDGRQIAALEVSVGRDFNVLRQTLRTALPGAAIEVRPAGDSILLTGAAASASEAQQAADIANAFVGVSSGLFSSAKGAVINSLTIKGKDQVMLRVTIAEVQRQVLKQLGVNLSAINWTIGKSTALNFLLGGSDLLTPSNVSADFRPNGPGKDVTRSVVRALEKNGMMRLLAEPTLVAVSGESAKFLAGGEIPYPSGETIDTTTLRSTTPSATARSREPQLHACRAFGAPHQPPHFDGGLGARQGDRDLAHERESSGHQDAADRDHGGGAVRRLSHIRRDDPAELAAGDRRLPGPQEPAHPRRPLPLARVRAAGDRAHDHGDALHRKAGGAGSGHPAR